MFWQQQDKAPLQAPARPASDMWDREGVLSKGVDDDAENPALNRKRRPSSAGTPGATEGGGAAGGDASADAARPARGGGCDFYKKGWFWAVVIVASIVCIAAPVGVATQRKIDREGMHPGALTPKSASGTYDKWAAAAAGGAAGSRLMFDPVSGTFSAGGGNRTVDVSKLTCADLAFDMPATEVPAGGKPPAPVASAADLDAAALAGVTWPGFDDGASTFLSGLSTGAGWAQGDLASAAYALRASGANAVRVPFAFTDLFTLPPRAAAHRCGAPAPGPSELAPPSSPKLDRAAAALVRPEAAGNAAAFCNAYVPAAALGGATSTLTRLLYTVQTLVESGHYVVLAYAPPAGAGGEAVVEAPESLAASWGRLWAALACLPGYGSRLAGRVFAEPLAAPGAHGIAWGGGKADNATAAATAPLAEYYSSAAAAIEAAAARGGAKEGPIYVLAGPAGQVASFAGGAKVGPRVVAAGDLYSGAAAKAAAWKGRVDLPGVRAWTADAAPPALQDKKKKEAEAAAAEGAAEGEGGGATAGAAGAAEPVRPVRAARGDGAKAAPGTVAAARAAARAAAGAPEIETGRR
jgi:hypothetical protein